jgi:hypothetical protein
LAEVLIKIAFPNVVVPVLEMVIAHLDVLNVVMEFAHPHNSINQYFEN